MLKLASSHTMMMGEKRNAMRRVPKCWKGGGQWEGEGGGDGGEEERDVPRAKVLEGRGGEGGDNGRKHLMQGRAAG